jgi:hypothetical protein
MYVGKLSIKSLDLPNMIKYRKDRNLNVVIVRNLSLRTHVLQNVREHIQEKSPIDVMNVRRFSVRRYN